MRITIAKSYDHYNKISNGQISLNLYSNDKQIGFVTFRVSGQVCLIDVNEKYRRRGFATHLLKEAEQHLISNKIFAICSKDHYFWSVQKNYFYDERPQQSITSSGYSKMI